MKKSRRPFPLEGLMFKKILWLFFTTTLALSACGTLQVQVERPSLQNTPTLDSTPTAPALTEPDSTSTPPDQILSMNSSPQAIQQKMLHSALNWKTIWIDGIN